MKSITVRRLWPLGSQDHKEQVGAAKEDIEVPRRPMSYGDLKDLEASWFAPGKKNVQKSCPYPRCGNGAQVA